MLEVSTFNTGRVAGKFPLLLNCLILLRSMPALWSWHESCSFANAEIFRTNHWRVQVREFINSCRHVLAAVTLSLVGLTAAQAGPVSTETWYIGGFDALGGPVTGAGFDCCDGVDAGPPPWTFTIADDHMLTVLDCCAVGDSFDIFNFGSPLGTSAVGSAGGECFTATSCDGNPFAGRGDFLLGAGSYEISMTVASYVGTPGNLFFIVRDVADVPEPGTLALLGLGLAGLAAARRRKQ